MAVVLAGKDQVDALCDCLAFTAAHEGGDIGQWASTVIWEIETKGPARVEAFGDPLGDIRMGTGCSSRAAAAFMWVARRIWAAGVSETQARLLSFPLVVVCAPDADNRLNGAGGLDALIEPQGHGFVLWIRTSLSVRAMAQAIARELAHLALGHVPLPTEYRAMLIEVARAIEVGQVTGEDLKVLAAFDDGQRADARVLAQGWVPKAVVAGLELAALE